MGTMIHPLVRSNFLSFSIPLEDCIYWIYCDILRLPTIGIGCLLTGVEQAIRLPFVERATRRPATEAQIRADWESVRKHRYSLARKGAQAAKEVTHLELTREGVEQLALLRLEE